MPARSLRKSRTLAHYPKNIQASALTIKAMQVMVRIWGNLLCNELYKTITIEYQIGYSDAQFLLATFLTRSLLLPSEKKSSIPSNQI